MAVTVVVCRGPVCGGRDSAALTDHLRESIARRGLGDRVRVGEEVCLGHCLRGPNVLVCDDAEAGPGRAVLYNRMTVSDLDRVIDRHLVGGIAVRPLMFRDPVRDR
jgi:(2Fe-2S) ferredoxin